MTTRFFIFIIILLQLTGCGGDGNGGTTAGPSIANSPIITGSGIGEITVDQYTGLNSPTYTQGKSFKTITYALNYVGNNPFYTKILVNPGIYNEANGEIFPLTIKNGISLVGLFGATLENNGVYGSAIVSNTLVNSPITVLLNGSSLISNFNIKTTDPYSVGVIVENGSPTILSNLITGGSQAIVTLSNSTPIIKANEISFNSIGIESKANSQPNISSNYIHDNLGGIMILDTSVPNLGTINLFGGNGIVKNTIYDLCNSTLNIVTATGNIWDVPVAAISAQALCQNGANIANIGGGAVNFIEPLTTTTPIFTAPEQVTLIAPSMGGVIANTKPSFTWNMNAKNLVAMGVFNKRIVITNGTIQNMNDLVYYWDSGMQTGRVGSIVFNDGKRYISGKLEGLPTPSPLNQGKAYYWAVWAWDSTGINIISASREGYFLVM